jgi:hypothetical protein
MDYGGLRMDGLKMDYGGFKWIMVDLNGLWQIKNGLWWIMNGSRWFMNGIWRINNRS